MHALVTRRCPSLFCLWLLVLTRSYTVLGFSIRPHQLEPLLRLHKKQTRLIKPLYSKNQISDDASATKTKQRDQVNTDFEAWFASQPNANCHPSIQHTIFGRLRGLTWKSDASKIPQEKVLQVPLSMVLQSSMQHQSESNTDWDAQLAYQLWQEYRRGRQSKIAGYCQFLTYGTDLATGDEAPPSTAPNALRHWKQNSPEALKILESTPAGIKLLEMEQQQEATWKNKYNQLMARTATITKSDMSWEQFQWAMEVVYSRAFRGNFGSNMASPESNDSATTLLVNFIPTIGATLGGWLYLQNNPFPDSLVLIALGLVAIAPVGLNVLRSSSTPPSAVLLPFIDSANHDEDSDSLIEYDPLSKSFQLRIGPKCFIPAPTASATGDNIQICISYGKRTDSDLLQNFGFLPNVPCADDKEPVENQRVRLTEEFNRRNSK